MISATSRISSVVKPRVVTAAVTTRGFTEEDIREVAEIIEITLKDYENKVDEARARVKALCEKYPLY